MFLLGRGSGRGAALALLFLAACGGGVDPEPPPTGTPPTQVECQELCKVPTDASIIGDSCRCTCSSTGEVETIPGPWPLPDATINQLVNEWEDSCPKG